MKPILINIIGKASQPIANTGLAQMGTGLVAAVAVAVTQFFVPTLLPVFDLDSPSYLAFGAFRFAIYPAFLDLFSDHVPSIIVAQLLVHLISVAGMFALLARARLPVLVLGVFLLAIMCHLLAQGYHYVIMTESLSLSLVFLIIGFMAVYVAEAKPKWLALAMLFATLIFGIKPNYIAFPIAVVLIAAIAMLFAKPTRQQLAKTTAAILVPLVLGMGFENAYFHAQHDARDGRLFTQHMFGKAALVLALGEKTKQDPNFYADGYEVLQPILARYGKELHADLGEVRANASYCHWLNVHMWYETAGYVDFHASNQQIINTALAQTGDVSQQKLAFVRRVLVAHPLSFAGVAGKYYLHFFCFVPENITSLVAANEFIPDNPDAIRKKIAPSLMPLIAVAYWLFLALGVAFFVAKFCYAWRWAKYGITAIKSTKKQPSITPAEKLGASLVLMAFGYQLAIAIFGVPQIRFHIISYPLIVLAILCLLTVLVGEWQARKNRR